MARNCPENNKRRSDKKGRPPGTAVNHLRLDLASTEQLRALAEDSPNVDGLSANMAHIAPVESDNEVAELLELDDTTLEPSLDYPLMYPTIVDKSQSPCPPIKLPLTSREGGPYYRCGNLYARKAMEIPTRGFHVKKVNN